MTTTLNIEKQILIHYYLSRLTLKCQLRAQLIVWYMFNYSLLIAENVIKIMF